MSILCCCGPRQMKCPEPGRDVLELPTRPPAAKLSKQPFPASEGGLPQQQIIVTRAPSLLHDQIAEATVDPTILEVEDSDSDEPVQSTRNSSTGTLGAIRTKFTRRISQRSECKRNSQQSLGTSDEEIARRAELKRLMHKRIQEELKSEEELEEDTDARASIPGEPKPDHPTDVECGPGGNMEVCEPRPSGIHLEDKKDSCPDAVLPTLLTGDPQPTVSLRRCSYPGPMSQTRGKSIAESRGSIKGRDSVPRFPSSPQLTPVRLPSTRGSESLCSWRLSYSAEQLANYLRLPDDSNIDQHDELIEIGYRSEVDEGDNNSKTGSAKYHSTKEESTANEEPTDGADHHELALSSGQQYGTNTAENSEKLCARSPHDTSLSRDSPLETWLRSQELQSISAVSSRRTSEIMIHQMGLEDLDTDRLKCLGNVDKSKILREHMRKTSGDSIASPNGHLQSQPGSSNLCTDTEAEQIELPIYWPNELQEPISRPSGSCDGEAPNSAKYAQEACSSYYTSSRYTSRPGSRQNTAKEPRLSLIELLGGRKTAAPFPNFNRFMSSSRTADVEKSEASSYKTAPNEASVLDVTRCEASQRRRPMAIESSAPASDTTSFKQREAELKSVEKRFGRVHLRRDNTARVVSRFREEFNETKVSTLTKNSILSRLHLPIPKKTKHPTEVIRRYSVHDVKCGPMELPVAGRGLLGRRELTKGFVDERLRVSPGMGWKVEDGGNDLGSLRQTNVDDMDASSAQPAQWDLSESSEPKDSTRINREQPSYTVKQRTPINWSPVGSTSRCPGNPGLEPRADNSSTLKPPCRLEHNGSPHSDISNSVLREWVNLMNDQATQHQAEPEIEDYGRAPRKFRTPPASWAKWPSHTRHERTGPAGKEDNVISKDFAVVVKNNGNGTTWSTDKPSEPSKRYITPTRSLSAQLGRAVKEGLSKVVHGTLSREAKTSSETSRSRQKPGTHLEYPELEILPMQGGYEELQALEQQIGTLKRGSMAAENQLARLDADNARTPLSLRLAEEVHILQHKASKVVCQDDGSTTPNPTVVFAMKAREVGSTSQGVLEMTGLSGAPQLNTDCIQIEHVHKLDNSQLANGGTKPPNDD